MPRRCALPSYRKHKLSGQAIVTFRLPGGKRKDYLLGRYGSKESKAEYARLLGEFQAAGGMLPSKAGEGPDVTINELLVRYLKHADEYYGHADRTPTGHALNIRDALKPLMGLCGHTMARNFGALSLEAIRDAMIETGICRRTINQRVGMTRHLFRWCLSKELVPAEVLVKLDSVSGLSPGRSRAGDLAEVEPAPPELVDKVMSLLPEPVAALVKLQLRPRSDPRRCP